MSLKHVVASVPGKLILAGEYAVLEPGEPAVVTAIDRRLIAKIAPDATPRFSAASIGMTQAPVRFQQGTWTLEGPPSPKAAFAAQAINTTLAYLAEIGKTVHPFSVTLEGSLESPEGLKYGFGSSAAVCVALVGGLLASHGVSPNAEQVFKLATLAHGAIQGNGSGLDVAASTYGGCVRYTACDRDWLHAEFEEGTRPAAMVEAEWPYFGIEPLGWPDSLLMAVGWTGSPASTRYLVAAVAEVAAQRTGAYARFLIESRTAVNRLSAALRDRDPVEAIAALSAARGALCSLQELSGVAIETGPLTHLADSAEQAGGAGKSSGAGGGDCGVAFFRSDAELRKAEVAWEAQGIEALEIMTWPQGLQIMQV